MTKNSELLLDSANHWRRLVAFAKKQPANSLWLPADFMKIDEGPYSNHCALCKKFNSFPSGCPLCPLSKIDEWCDSEGSIWRMVASTNTWGEFAKAGATMERLLRKLYREESKKEQKPCLK